MDLDAYLSRVRYDAPRRPTLDTLRALHLLHPQAIPFENLNPLLRWPVALDLPAIARKLVDERRGGYCYEHNLLFGAALRALGFEVTWLGARVMLNAPEGRINARTHMLLRVDVQGAPYIADVGFGGLTLTAPLRFAAGVVQETPHEPFRIAAAGSAFVLEAQIGGDWRPLYQFDLQEQVLADYELASWYLCDFPQSHFLSGLYAARVDGDCRHALRGIELARHRRGVPSERRPLTTAAELRGVLTDVFHIQLPEGADVEALLQRLVS